MFALRLELPVSVCLFSATERLEVGYPVEGEAIVRFYQNTGAGLYREKHHSYGFFRGAYSLTSKTIQVCNDCTLGTETWDHNDAGDIRQVTNALGKTTTYLFDTVNDVRRLASEPTSDCLESNTSYQYDAAGNVSLKITNCVLTRYEYNPDNQQVKRVEAIGTPEERTVLTHWDPTHRKPREVEYPDQVISYSRLEWLSVESYRDPQALS